MILSPHACDVLLIGSFGEFNGGEGLIGVASIRGSEAFGFCVAIFVVRERGGYVN